MMDVSLVYIVLLELDRVIAIGAALDWKLVIAVDSPCDMTLNVPVVAAVRFIPTSMRSAPAGTVNSIGKPVKVLLENESTTGTGTLALTGNPNASCNCMTTSVLCATGDENMVGSAAYNPNFTCGIIAVVIFADAGTYPDAEAVMLLNPAVTVVVKFTVADELPWGIITEPGTPATSGNDDVSSTVTGAVAT